MTGQHALAAAFAIVMLGWQFWPGIKSLFTNVKLPAFSWGWFARKTTAPTVTANPTFADATSALTIIANFRKTVAKDTLECAMFEAGLKRLTEAAA